MIRGLVGEAIGKDGDIPRNVEIEVSQMVLTLEARRGYLAAKLAAPAPRAPQLGSARLHS